MKKIYKKKIKKKIKKKEKIKILKFISELIKNFNI